MANQATQGTAISLISLLVQFDFFVLSVYITLVFKNAVGRLLTRLSLAKQLILFVSFKACLIKVHGLIK